MAHKQHKTVKPDVCMPKRSPVLTSTVKTNQNVTNINISSEPRANHPPTNTNSTAPDLQIFQKGPQVTALVAKLPGIDAPREPSHTSLPIRSKSSLSNVSSTHIPAPSPQPSDHSCHKSHRHKHRSSRNGGSSKTTNSQSLDHSHRNNHHHNDHHYSQDEEKTYRADSSLMDANYKKAAMIVHDLTKRKENGYDASLYEKHRQKCITASEKYNSHLLKHYNARKSASVLDFRSQANSSRSTDSLDAIEGERKNNKAAHHHHQRIDDYASEPDGKQHLDGFKPRPTPPKKPIRLSLHKAQSLQSVETPLTNSNVSLDDMRKPMKRNHKGDVQHLGYVAMKIEDYKDVGCRSPTNSLGSLKWTSFTPGKYIENGK